MRIVLFILIQVLWPGTVEAADKCDVKDVTLYLSDSLGVQSMIPNSNFSASRPLIKDGAKRIITSMSYNPSNQRLFFVDQVHANQIHWYDIKSNKTGFLEFKDEQFIELAVDEATQNIYYITREYSIGACNSDNKKRIILIPASDKKSRLTRHHLILHPKLNLMFWIDNIPHADKVQMAKMDGTEIRQIQSTTVVKALALDSLNDYLYLAEGPKMTRVNLNTMISTEFSKHSTNYLFYFDCRLFFKIGSLTVFEVGSGAGKTFQQFSSTIVAMSAETTSAVKFSKNPCHPDTCGDNKLCVFGESSGKSPNAEAFHKCVESPQKKSNEEVKSGGGWKLLIWLLVFVVLLVAAFCFFKFTEKGREIWISISTKCRSAWVYLC